MFAGKLRSTLCLDVPISAIAVSNDGYALATACSNSAFVWSTEDYGLRLQLNKPGHHIHRRDIRVVRFTPCGNYVVTCGDDLKIVIWNLTTGYTHKVMMGHRDIIFDAQFRADNDRLLVTCSADGDIFEWNWYEGRKMGSVATEMCGIRSTHMVPDLPNRMVAACANGTVAVYDTEAHVKMGSVEPDTEWKQNRLTASTAGWIDNQRHHSGALYAARLSPDGNTLATACNDATVKLWNFTSFRQDRKTIEGFARLGSQDPRHENVHIDKKPGDEAALDRGYRAALLQTLRHDSGCRHVAFSRDSRMVVTTALDSSCKVWLVATGAQVFHLNFPVPVCDMHIQHAEGPFQSIDENITAASANARLAGRGGRGNNNNTINGEVASSSSRRNKKQPRYMQDKSQVETSPISGIPATARSTAFALDARSHKSLSKVERKAVNYLDPFSEPEGHYVGRMFVAVDKRVFAFDFAVHAYVQPRKGPSPRKDKASVTYKQRQVELLEAQKWENQQGGPKDLVGGLALLNLSSLGRHVVSTSKASELIEKLRSGSLDENALEQQMKGVAKSPRSKKDSREAKSTNKKQGTSGGGEGDVGNGVKSLYDNSDPYIHFAIDGGSGCKKRKGSKQQQQQQQQQQLQHGGDSAVDNSVIVHATFAPDFLEGMISRTPGIDRVQLAKNMAVYHLRTADVLKVVSSTGNFKPETVLKALAGPDDEAYPLYRDLLAGLPVDQTLLELGHRPTIAAVNAALAASLEKEKARRQGKRTGNPLLQYEEPSAMTLELNNSSGVQGRGNPPDISGPLNLGVDRVAFPTNNDKSMFSINLGFEKLQNPDLDTFVYIKVPNEHSTEPGREANFSKRQVGNFHVPTASDIDIKQSWGPVPWTTVTVKDTMSAEMRKRMAMRQEQQQTLAQGYKVSKDGTVSITKDAAGGVKSSSFAYPAVTTQASLNSLAHLDTSRIVSSRKDQYGGGGGGGAGCADAVRNKDVFGKPKTPARPPEVVKFMPFQHLSILSKLVLGKDVAETHHRSHLQTKKYPQLKLDPDTEESLKKLLEKRIRSPAMTSPLERVELARMQRYNEEMVEKARQAANHAAGSSVAAAALLTATGHLQASSSSSASSPSSSSSSSASDGESPGLLHHGSSHPAPGGDKVAIPIKLPILLPGTTAHRQAGNFLMPGSGRSMSQVPGLSHGSPGYRELTDGTGQGKGLQVLVAKNLPVQAGQTLAHSSPRDILQAMKPEALLGMDAEKQLEILRTGRLMEEARALESFATLVNKQVVPNGVIAPSEAVKRQQMMAFTKDLTPLLQGTYVTDGSGRPYDKGSIPSTLEDLVDMYQTNRPTKKGARYTLQTTEAKKTAALRRSDDIETSMIKGMDVYWEHEKDGPQASKSRGLVAQPGAGKEVLVREFELEKKEAVVKPQQDGDDDEEEEGEEEEEDDVDVGKEGDDGDGEGMFMTQGEAEDGISTSHDQMSAYERTEEGDIETFQE